jgi:hypothetical protein
MKRSHDEAAQIRLRDAHDERQREYRLRLTPQKRQAQREADTVRHRRVRTTNHTDVILQQNDSDTSAQQTKWDKARTAIRTLLSQRPIPPRKLFRIARKYDIDQIHELKVHSLSTEHTCGLMNIDCSECKSCMWLAERVGGTIQNPKFGLCCLSGKIKIPLLRDPPLPLATLLTEQTPQSKYFHNNIRHFNNAMSMATMKATNATMTGGVANYRINGMVYRIIGPPRNAPDTNPVSMQTYFYDSEEQTRQRLQACPPQPQNVQTETNILQSLQDILHNAPNTYSQSFLNIQQLVEQQTVPQDIHIHTR